ncbi:condensation domain-containing protein [Pseudoalteromonas sp. MMG005]|uniref:condensation domain-containing protein n=1 Tax=Pseudoalteromonas sp. MMG005 TaxID=2822682 RepID=UPI001B3A3425|nr:condensation domain-containing protein [Pseudoalteromonas sp. MMG005]MBQ4844011.1 hypothetical protein [Pseudoalteromonas sp. MMG005]
MSDLEKMLSRLSPAKQAILRKRMKGKAVELDDQQSVQTLVQTPNEQYVPYQPRAFQQAQLAAATEHGFCAWFYMETHRVGLDVSLFTQTIQVLVNHHAILQSRFVGDESEICLKQDKITDWQAQVIDLRTVSAHDASAQLAALREAFRRPRTIKESESFKITVCQLPNEELRIFLGADLTLLDLVSVEFLALQWRQLYEGRKVLTDFGALTFRDYSHTERVFQESSRQWSTSKDYWLSKLDELPRILTVDDIAENSQKLDIFDDQRFDYRVDLLPKSLWTKLKRYASEQKLTGSMVVYSLFTLVLSELSKIRRFSLEMRLFNRISFDTKVNDILGQYSSGILSSVDLSRQQNLQAYCRAIESQTWTDLDNGFYDVVSEQALSGKQKKPGIVFTSTISRYNEFVEEGSIPPMKWFGAMQDGVAHVPNQALELLIVENDGMLELHWFCDYSRSGNALTSIMQQTEQLILRVAQDPAFAFDTPLNDLQRILRESNQLMESAI